MFVKLEFYVPLDDAESVKEALFAVGAGKIGAYSHCAWQSEGQGQFKPLENSQPYVGQKGSMTKLKEYKVEMVVEKALINKVVETLKAAHPYETVAFQVIEVMQ
ncbi:MAG: NGG1p interacting factor NIF3 [Legionellales bacterium]|nr:NGG1p interacting factor NIF3 [Legionellales bacterium]OUX67775.1 MAG: NGG1p interacting factor NIF3 [bacterium TMED178]|tara:strand:- start:597 stop:908 length:312 start_codon:yes stop_codon:yes gene_type:complete